MAWNEPGNGKGNGNGGGKDPWGGRNDQGPPDLDEVFQKAQESLSRLFGGGGNKGRGNGSGSDGGSINPVPIFIAVVVVIGLMAAYSSAYQVQQAEQALVLRTGKFYKIEGAGLKFKFPIIDEVYKVNTQAVRSMQLDAAMLTADNNIVDISLVIQYQVADPRSYLLSIAQPEDGLHHATESALRHVVGGMHMDAVITEQRQQVAILVKDILQKSLDRFSTGLLISEVSMQDANPPKQVKSAFDDVNKAKEDEERLKNEAEAYANGVIPEARGMAKRQMEEAEGYKQSVIARAEGEADRFNKLLKEYNRAPSVTRKRMYLETMEEVLANTTKVMIDVEGGNNLLYLPLDKLMSQSATPSMESEAIKQAARDNVKRLSESSPRGADRVRQYRDRRQENK